MTHATKILAVDDREENLVALAAVLDALPVEVVPVSSGQAALKELLNDDFALILLDVVMPDMDGFETAAHIKSRPRTRDIPIIFLTAAGSAEEQVYRGYQLGAVDYVTKPFDPWLLRAKVQVFVELHRRHMGLRRQAELLRRAVAGGDPATGEGDRLLRSLGERLARVEEDVARLRSRRGGAAVEDEDLDRLDGHVADLREALDALFPSDQPPP
ncbi:response regulator [Actinomadura rubrobrunea]|uniref:Response regulator n=1 Tax=Actinomadura rubrobrunea TaxID=115335 RepID=A0A9W6PS91_9ACTN|nr:response regulator [Actinomadura rubrobrunea]GLW61947.1 response regulator [Actinomadura rubrobrunea]